MTTQQIICAAHSQRAFRRLPAQALMLPSLPTATALGQPIADCPRLPDTCLRDPKAIRARIIEAAPTAGHPQLHFSRFLPPTGNVRPPKSTPSLRLLQGVNIC